MSFVPSFTIGEIITNTQLYKEFACGNASGIRPSNKNNCIVVVSNHTKSLYDDKWYGNILHYTGMGSTGDQTLSGNNKTLYEAKNNGKKVYLFEVLKSTEYIYRGPVELCGKPYQELQLDEGGSTRKVWMFPLKLAHSDSVIDKETFDKYLDNCQKKVHKLSDTELAQKAKLQSKKETSYRAVVSKVYVRDPIVSEFAKRKAMGICQLCGQKAPFQDQKGNPYLETHHIEWLSKGGLDSIENTVALCPNCHRKMHVINDPKDVEALKKKSNNKEKCSTI